MARNRHTSEQIIGKLREAEVEKRYARIGVSTFPATSVRR